MAELYLCYPSSSLTKEINRLMKTKKPKRETIEPHSSARLGRNFPTSVVDRKSNTALSHFSMESSSEICTRRHLPASPPIAFPTAFQSVLSWSFHRLQWRKRCSRVWTVLPPPPENQHLSSVIRSGPAGRRPDFRFAVRPDKVLDPRGHPKPGQIKINL